MDAIAKAGPDERPKLAAALKTSRDGRTQNPEKPQPVYHQPPPASSRREAIRQIEEISAEVEKDKERSTEDNMLCSLDGEIDSFMELFDHIFLEYPRLLSDGGYRQKLVQIMQKLKQYILTIEGGHRK